ncbi:MAG TPA: hypothetical protein VLA05_09055 [Coriobacteriia bacterium]|nr:hypothetical protein [Coriobacteriia bacterium]
MPSAYPVRLVFAALALLLLTACGAKAPLWVDEDGAYTSETALELAEQVDPGSVADRPTSDALELRHDALVALRREGGGASDAATLITRTFPSDSSGVPFYVESATYESEPALVIVEAIGREGGKLEDERVWVLSTSGDVLLSGTR